MLASFHKVPNT